MQIKSLQIKKFETTPCIQFEHTARKSETENKTKIFSKYKKLWRLNHSLHNDCRIKKKPIEK